MSKIPLRRKYIVFITAAFILIYFIQDYSYVLLSEQKISYDYSKPLFVSLIYIIWALSISFIYKVVSYLNFKVHAFSWRICIWIFLGLVTGIIVQTLSNLIYSIVIIQLQERSFMNLIPDVLAHVKHGFIARMVEFWILMVILWVFINIKNHKELFPDFKQIARYFLPPPIWKESIPITDKGKTLVIQTSNIYWFESNGNYVNIHLEDNKSLIRTTINGLMKKIDKEQFIRVHRSLIVNKSKITTINHKRNGEFIITLSNNVRLESSRSFKAIVEELKDLILGSGGSIATI